MMWTCSEDFIPLADVTITVRTWSYRKVLIVSVKTISVQTLSTAGLLRPRDLYQAFRLMASWPPGYKVRQCNALYPPEITVLCHMPKWHQCPGHPTWNTICPDKFSGSQTGWILKWIVYTVSSSLSHSLLCLLCLITCTTEVTTSQ